MASIDSTESKQEPGSSHYRLIKFLRGGYGESVDGTNEQSYMHIHIIDSINGILEDRSFKILSGDRDALTFLAVLKARPANVKTRLILVQAKKLNNNNRAYIEAIASHFMLSPYFFSAYLQLGLRGSRHPNLATTTLPVLLPSERTFLQLVQDDHSHMIATVARSKGGNTIIVLGLDDGAGRVTALRGHLLNQYSEEDVNVADEILPNYLYPFVLESARHAAHTCNVHSGHDSTTSPAAVDAAFYGQLWHRNHIHHKRLVDSMSSITKFIADPKISEQASFIKWQTLLDDYATLIKETDVIGSVMQTRLQQSVNLQAMEETKRGSRQADSVKRLALVAFILNFATSFFGMNVKQLGTGTIHLGYFFLLAALAGCLVYILSAAVMSIETAWLEARRRYAIREREDDGGIAHVTKSNLFWAFLQRIYE